MNRPIACFLLALALGLTLIVAGGCGKPEPAAAPGRAESSPVGTTESSPVGTDAAIVPGADLILDVDMADARGTPIYAAVKARNEAGNTSEDEAPSEKARQIEELTGLTDEDVLSILVSADLDTIDIDSPTMYKELQQGSIALALEVSKALTFEQLYKTMGILSSDSKGARLDQFELAGRPIGRITPTSPKEPVVLAALSGAGTTVLIAFTEPNMTAMLERDRSGTSEPISPGLESLAQTLPAGSQIRLLLLASDAMRANIREKMRVLGEPEVAGKPTPTTMMLSFLGPLQNIQTLSFGLKADEVATVAIAGALERPEDAQQCSQMFNAFLVPIAQKAIEQEDPENKLQVDDSIKVVDDGPILRISFVVAQQDIENWSFGVPSGEQVPD